MVRKPQERKQPNLRTVKARTGLYRTAGEKLFDGKYLSVAVTAPRGADQAFTSAHSLSIPQFLNFK